jgi:hypothetical protein
MQLADKEVDDLAHLILSQIKQDPSHRYKSWDHCHNYFLTAKGKIKQGQTVDLKDASLMLAFYLASWGMLRNSGLLWKDYTVHINVANIVLSNTYDVLWNDCTFDDKFTALCIELYNEIEEAYEQIDYFRWDTKSKKYEKGTVSATATLVTKVILGTIGCLPAYDDYFMYSAKTLIHGNHSLSKTRRQQSIKTLVNYVNGNQNKLCAVQKESIGIIENCTIMKVVDMIFWEYGIAHKDMHT